MAIVCCVLCVCVCVLCGVQNKLSYNIYQYVFYVLEIVLQSEVEAKHVFIIQKPVRLQRDMYLQMTVFRLYVRITVMLGLRLTMGLYFRHCEEQNTKSISSLRSDNPGNRMAYSV